MNEQRPEGCVDQKDGLLDIHSIFRTIQGEGPFVGTPAVFIRFAGCTLQCPLCDTDYTTGRKLMSVGRIFGEVDSLQSSGLVVLTGGEPLRQDINKLVGGLVTGGYKVQIETNGTCYQPIVSWSSVNVVCSPKNSTIHPNLRSHIDVFKYVVRAGWVDEDDGLPVLTMGNKNRVAKPFYHDAEIFIQPVDEKNEELNKLNLQAAIDSCMKFDHRLCLQVHKIIGMD